MLPLADPEFATLMARLGPFEPAPHLAVAASGGADSMALLLLLSRWIRDQGGMLTALHVDHRLRPGSSEEAGQVAEWARARGLTLECLVWDDPDRLQSGGGGRQARARQARYRLLEEWCEAHAVLHLLTAHHRDDQAETFLLRLARGSGLFGLAGMAMIVERTHCRLLRPLLEVPRPRLEATCHAHGQAWIDDPSNRDPSYARVKMRALLPLLSRAGVDEEALSGTASRLARARAALEDAIAALLARAAFLHPAGFVRFDPALLEGAPREIGLRALAAILTTVSGHPYPPRLQGLERLLGGLPRVTEGGKTLGGCRLLASRGTVLVCREPAAMASAVPLVPGGLARWDGRFGLKVPLDAPQGLTFGALLTLPGIARPGDIPGAVVPTLPALRLDREVVFAPHLRYVKPGWDAAWVKERVRFQPTRPLTHAGFTVV